MTTLPSGILRPVVLATEAGLESWEIGLVAFGFVGVVLLVGHLLEWWEVRLHA